MRSLVEAPGALTVGYCASGGVRNPAAVKCLARRSDGWAVGGFHRHGTRRRYVFGSGGTAESDISQ